MVGHKPAVPRKTETIFVEVPNKQANIPPFQDMVNKLLNSDTKEYENREAQIICSHLRIALENGVENARHHIQISL